MIISIGFYAELILNASQRVALKSVQISNVKNCDRSILQWIKFAVFLAKFAFNYKTGTNVIFDACMFWYFEIKTFTLKLSAIS